jgi:hypothetical protein
MSGYIPYKLNASESHIIYMKGVTLDTSKSHHRMVFWRNNGTNPVLIGNALIATYFNVETLGDKYYKLTPKVTDILNGRGSLTHIRICAGGTGENWVVQLDTPIE